MMVDVLSETVCILYSPRMVFFSIDVAMICVHMKKCLLSFYVVLVNDQHLMKGLGTVVVLFYIVASRISESLYICSYCTELALCIFALTFSDLLAAVYWRFIVCI